jgi:hypothetical protein
VEGLNQIANNRDGNAHDRPNYGAGSELYDLVGTHFAAQAGKQKFRTAHRVAERFTKKPST